ncbi:hypothetical protein GCM10023093_15320 [Nemorincola caseinilytica]|uniref:N-acetyltransferase domain-containing protein n=1 Tax=Nemorincola caseinilytica TaxID=2054315 RepID=A0ABP8NEQ6_9BACT
MQNMEIYIRRATKEDAPVIAEIGRVTVRQAHMASCSEADMDHFISGHYNDAAIQKELSGPQHIYHLLFCGERAVGFSKIVLNAGHPNIGDANVTKLDRIYLYSHVLGQRLGYRLLQHNIDLSKAQGQCAMWLFTWTGNERAVAFYKRAGFDIVGEHMFKISETHSNPNHQMLLRY